MRNIDYVKSYNFAKVSASLVKRGHSESSANTAVEHLRAFMTLTAMYPGKNFAAWRLMDDAWHEFIVRTMEYADFCQNAFGHFLHHDADAFGTTEFEGAWSETVKLIRLHFGIELVVDPNAAGNDNSAATCMVQAATCMVAATCMIQRSA